MTASTTATTTRNMQDWVNAFRQANDNDQAIQAEGKYFSCSYLLDMEQHRFLVQMHRGKVENVLVDPEPLDEQYQFAIRASADTWRKFAQAIPLPMYHGIWAASFREDMRLEGDILVLMQHLRNLTVQLEFLRQTGVPV